MRIYFFCYGITGRGGMETALSAVARGLLNKGHDVKIILTGYPTYYEWADGLPVIYTPSVRKHSDKAVFKINSNIGNMILLRRLLRRLPRADIIVALDPWNVAVARSAVEGFHPRPLIASWVHFSIEAIHSKQYFPLADFHLAISKDIQDDIIFLTGNTNTYKVYNPISLNNEKVARPRTTSFLYVGRLFNYQKRVDKILNALSKVSGDWKLQIIGDGEDAPMLQGMASELGIIDRIVWEGWQSDPWAHVKEATSLIMASDFEGLPYSAIEALSRGIPVVSGDRSGLNEIIINGMNGWLYPYQEVTALTDILDSIVRRLLPLPNQDRVQASVAQFSEQAIIDQLEQIFLEMRTKDIPSQWIPTGQFRTLPFSPLLLKNKLTIRKPKRRRKKSSGAKRIRRTSNFEKLSQKKRQIQRRLPLRNKRTKKRSTPALTSKRVKRMAGSKNVKWRKK